MKKVIFSAAVAAILAAGCAKEIAPVTETDGNQKLCTVTALAYAPGSTDETKVKYTDGYTEVEPESDLAATWESGDSFKALEINGANVKAVTFTTSGSGASASFTSTDAVEPTESTIWVAISGNSSVSASGDTLCCSYSGQNGTLADIGKYSYNKVTAQGTAPVFNFAAKSAKKYTYIMRVILPGGIKYIEYNTGVAHSGGWEFPKDGKAYETVSTTVKAAVSTIELANPSVEGQLAYIALPAINYSHLERKDARDAGLIITLMDENKTHSDGRTMSTNLSSKGGKLNTYDMSDLVLIDRPRTSEAIDLGSVSIDGRTYKLGAWAPFNLGGSYPTSDDNIKGELYAWGETKTKASFSKENYKFYNGGTYTTQIGYKYENIVEGIQPCIAFTAAGGDNPCSPSSGRPYYDIGGTKFDAARVRWGSEWRLPSNEIAANVLKQGNPYLTPDIDTGNQVDYDYYTGGTYENDYGFTSSYGAFVVSANGREVPFYLVPFTDNGSTQNGSGRYWTSTTDYGTNDTSYWYNRACQMRLSTESGYITDKSWIWDGLSIKPVLND